MALVKLNATLGLTGTLPAVSGANLTNIDGGKIGQVISATKVDTWSSSGTGNYQAVTGLSVAITPSASSSKLLVSFDVTGHNNDYGGGYSLFRGGSQLVNPTSPASRSTVNASNFNSSSAEIINAGFHYLDAPSSTSELTYQVYVYVRSGTYYVNRTGSDSNNDDRIRGASSITVKEVLA